MRLLTPEGRFRSVNIPEELFASFEVPRGDRKVGSARAQSKLKAKMVHPEQEAEQEAKERRSGNSTGTLVRENRALLAELIVQLSQIDPRLFAAECDGAGLGHTIGRHCRHVCDHYDALFLGFDGPASDAVLIVDYDKRNRCSRTEQHLEHCVARLEECRQRLEALSAADGQQAVHLSADVYAGSKGRTEMTSSLARELAFLASHTTHHSALISILLQGMNVRPAPDFGRAAATRAYENS